MGSLTHAVNAIVTGYVTPSIAVATPPITVATVVPQLGTVALLVAAVMAAIVIA